MKITELIAQHITDVFEGGNWTEVCIKDVLGDVDYIEATTVTKASYNTLAALLYHLYFYNEVVLKRLLGINPVIDKNNGFDVPLITNECEWQTIKNKTFESAQILANAVRKFPEEHLEDQTVAGNSNYYKTLHGIAEHAHYHLGQMMMLKKMIRHTTPLLMQRSSL